MNQTQWAIICHSTLGEKGVADIISSDGKQGFRCNTIPSSPATGLPFERRPLFIGITDNNNALVLDPVTKKITAQDSLTLDAFPIYAYPDTSNQRLWFVNDGDNETFCDKLDCGDKGASATVVEHNEKPKALKTICLGRGHHVTVFVGPNKAHPAQPKLAFQSNLNDGTISIVGNDEKNPATFLSVIKTIDLCEIDKEDDKNISVPNNAFPHGMVYSPVTHRVYNLNNGYGNIVVINPGTLEIEKRIPLKGCSNLLGSPDGKYLIGKGADRKADNNHVIGKLAVIDAVTGDNKTELKLKDFYPSVYRFSSNGKKLYVTSASTGKGVQKDNLKNNILQIYDASKLPALTLIKEVEVGVADIGRRPIAFSLQNSEAQHVFVPNPTDATLSVLDAKTDTVIETIKLSSASDDFNFSFWNKQMYGA